MAEYIVFWKDAPGQQVHTVVDTNNEPVRRDEEYLRLNKIPILDSDEDVLSALAAAEGDKYAVAPIVARRTLGWNV